MKPIYKLLLFIITYALSVLMILEKVFVSQFNTGSTLTIETELSKWRQTDEAHINHYKNGYISMQEWRPIYNRDVDFLLLHPLIPNFPEKSGLIKDFSEVCCQENVAARVFGWITPNVTGSYIFCLTSDKNTIFQLMDWPFSHEKLLNISIRVQKTTPSVAINVSSGRIHLTKDKSYYFEILSVQTNKNCLFSLKWRSPIYNSYRKIDRRHFSLLHSTDMNINLFNKKLVRLKRKYKHFHLQNAKLPLPNCMMNKRQREYKVLEKYEGVEQRYLKEVWTEMYPRDLTWDVIDMCDETKPDVYCSGNRVLPTNEAIRIVEKIMVYALEVFDGDCELKKLIRVERHKEEGNIGPSRIFLELILHRPYKNMDVAVSTYVFEQESHELCYDKRYAWDAKSIVHIILTVSNQGAWLKYILALIREISKVTFDERIRVIVADFNSTDIDVRKSLNDSKLRHHQYVKLDKPFVKFKGIQAGLDRIIDDDSIALLMDLHMQIPINFFDLIRKHTIKGKMAFNPIVMRLAAGRYETDPAGFWEIMGFGVISMYKKDWKRIKRLDALQSKESWGGEDWELVDYITMAGIEISRFRIDGFYHYYHTHQHLWNGSSLASEDMK